MAEIGTDSDGGATVPTLTAGRIGAVAWEVLRGGKRFEAVAVFARSFYIEDENGRLACVLADGMEPGPLNVVCCCWPEHLGDVLAVGDGWEHREPGLLLAPGLGLRFRSAALWQPVPYPSVAPDDVRRGLRLLPEAVRRHCPDDSATAILIGEKPLPGGVDNLAGVLLSEIGKGVASLADWLNGDPPVMAEQAMSLLGLGGGLTPSGDDVLGGAVLGLHACGLRDDADRLAALVTAHAPAATNRISQAHLEAACRGMGAAPIHEFIRAIMGGGGGLDEAARRVGNIGHTSGWDAVLGIAIALRSYMARMP